MNQVLGNMVCFCGTEFTPNAHNQKWCTPQCKAKHWARKRGRTPEVIALQKAWKARNLTPERKKGYQLVSRYDMTLEEFRAQEAAQSHKCAICRKEASLVVDHSHTTQKRRALLCRTCNAFLGWVERVGVENVVAYLRSFQ